MNRGPLIHTLFGLVAWIGCLSAVRAEPTPPESPGTLAIDVGAPADTNHLGFGWSQAERGKGFLFRWVKHLEADVDFDLDESRPHMLSVRAAPLYLNWQRQRIGIYLNNRYFGEWVCPDSHVFKTYTARIPARFFRAGRNRLTLRMGYRKGHGSDERELSLAVSEIRFNRF